MQNEQNENAGEGKKMSSLVIIILCAAVAIGAILITHNSRNKVTEIAEEVIEYEVHQLELPAEPLERDPQNPHNPQ